MTHAFRFLVCMCVLGGICCAQPLLPLQPAGFRDHTFVNSTMSGAPLLTTTIWYPATVAGPNAPMAATPAGGFPVIVFLHGRCAIADNYTHLPLALASQGFVVVLEDSAGCMEDAQRDDAIALYHTLFVANQAPTEFLYQTMNLQCVGLAGHSMGAGNVGRVLAINPGFEAGVAFGVWNGPGSSNWQLTAAPQIQDPLLFIHGMGDSITTYQNTAQAWWNLMPAPAGIHVLHLFDTDVDHFNIALPAWPQHNTALDFAVFIRTMEVVSNFFRRFLVQEPTALENVVGASALSATFTQQILVKVGEPQLWSDVLPATGQTHCLNVLSAPGFAGIYVAVAAAQIPTPIGQLLIDPTTAVPLVQGSPSPDNRLSICIPMPPSPALIGAWYIHQALGTTETGGIYLSPAVDFTILN